MKASEIAASRDIAVASDRGAGLHIPSQRRDKNPDHRPRLEIPEMRPNQK